MSRITETTLLIIQAMKIEDRRLLFEKLFCGSLTEQTGFLVIPENMFDQIGMHIAEEIGELAAQKAGDVVEKTLAAMRLMGEQMAQLKARQRGSRTSSPATIKRNAEICAMRRDNPTRWTIEQLRKEYNFRSTRSITKIVKEQKKWFEKAKVLKLLAAIRASSHPSQEPPPGIN